MYHPPIPKDFEGEDLSEQAVPKNHFIRMKFLESGGRWIWRILAGLAVIALITVVGLISYVGLGVIASLLLASGAYAHDAPKSISQPLGWTYGWECCSLRDCAPVEPSDIGESSAGYVIRRTGEVIAYSDKRIKRSRDEFYHRCTPAGNMDSPRSICLYVPDRGF